MPSRIGIIVKYILFEIFLSFCKKCADMQKKNCDLILALDLPDKESALEMLGTLKGLFRRNLLTKLSAMLMRKNLYAVKDRFDVSEYGGAPLLGLSKPVIKAHGSSDAKAIRNAVRQAVRFAEADLNGIIAE